MKQIEEKVLNIVKAHVGKRRAKDVTLDSLLKDELGFDMLDFTLLEMAFQDKGIYLAYTQLAACDTVQEIVYLAM